MRAPVRSGSPALVPCPVTPHAWPRHPPACRCLRRTDSDLSPHSATKSWPRQSRRPSLPQLRGPSTKESGPAILRSEVPLALATHLRPSPHCPDRPRAAPASREQQGRRRSQWPAGRRPRPRPLASGLSQRAAIG